MHGRDVSCICCVVCTECFVYGLPTRHAFAAAAAEWEEKRRLAVERQQAKLREGTAAFLQKQMEENERQKVIVVIGLWRNQ